MTEGAGRYHAEAKELQKRLNARGVVLIVIGGDRGHGFEAIMKPEDLVQLPGVLEGIVAEVRKDIAAAGN